MNSTGYASYGTGYASSAPGDSSYSTGYGTGYGTGYASSGPGYASSVPGYGGNSQEVITILTTTTITYTVYAAFSLLPKVRQLIHSQALAPYTLPLQPTTQRTQP